jgi:hypothetical protein
MYRLPLKKYRPASLNFRISSAQPSISSGGTSFACNKSDFGQILDSDGTVLLCLHEWGAHEHPSLTSPSYANGNGLLLFFRVDNYDVALRRARALVSQLAEQPHVNPNTGTAEFSLRGPDGYYVTISALNSV